MELKGKKTTFKNRIDVLFKGIEWMIYIGFCILAAYFMKGVLDQYQAKDTYMGQSLEAITKMPTMTICIESDYYWPYSNGLVVLSYRSGNDNGNALKENEPFHLGEVDGNETVVLEQFTSDCYILTSTISLELKRGSSRYIALSFPGIKTEYLPSLIKVSFTSKENSYGVYNSEWYDGQVFRQNVKPGHFAKVSLKPVEYGYLDNGQCSYESFSEQWISYIPYANFSQCSKICTHLLFLVSKDLPLCGWNSDESQLRTCAKNALSQNYDEFKANVDYKRPCSILEYSGETSYYGLIDDSKTFAFQYSFSPPEMTLRYTERLVFDVVGMVGSVGGTLGMCIGFSFSGITSNILEFIKSSMKARY